MYRFFSLSFDDRAVRRVDFVNVFVFVGSARANVPAFIIII